MDEETGKQPPSTKQPVVAVPTQEATETNTSDKKISFNKILLMVLGVVGILTITLLVFYYLNTNQTAKKQTPSSQEKQSLTPIPTVQKEQDDSFSVEIPIDWETYFDDLYKYEIRYPSSWLFTTKVRSSVLTWGEGDIDPLDYKNIYTQRHGNPAIDELSTTITISVFNKDANLSTLDWISTTLPNMPKVKEGDLNTALQKANTGSYGLLTKNQSNDNNFETFEFGAVILKGYFDYATFFHKVGSTKVYSIELSLPLRSPSVKDTDEEYLKVYKQILSTFKLSE